MTTPTNKTEEVATYIFDGQTSIMLRSELDDDGMLWIALDARRKRLPMRAPPAKLREFARLLLHWTERFA